MPVRRTAAAALAVLALTATAACGKSGSPTAGAPSTGYTVRTDVKLDGSATFAAAKARGKLVIGAKADQPGLGFEDITANTRNGFDIEIARMVAADLGFPESQIEWRTIDSANRETALAGGQIDYYVGTYSINDKRKTQVSFAGPYYLAGQDLLVRKDNTDITGPESTKGRRVCTVTGSTSVDAIRTYGAEVTTFGSYSQCVDKLITKDVDAVTTDDAILKGYAAQNPGELRVVGKPFTTEKYGVGLNKDDKVLRAAVDDALKAHEDSGDWKAAYDRTLGTAGSAAPQPPALERY
ncbi:glutamate ABC transporter substrate-binding protein [Kitasatospora mediocidica]|uniref:glutamate ABC transporter substrate-binding protein n=1 Tax=Kitasatospora mediocidica TaxID=58352 RepID=UPI00055C7F9A|nr:glutamate ABC transporter substrate-binding protein [Kitasatospora mediocidica]